MKNKPSRKELLKTIRDIQDLIGQAQALHGNDRDPFGFQNGQKRLSEAFDLCVEAQRYDDPYSY